MNTTWWNIDFHTYADNMNWDKNCGRSEISPNHRALGTSLDALARTQYLHDVAHFPGSQKQNSQTSQASARKPFIHRPCPPPLLLLVVRAWACVPLVRKTIGMVRLSHPSAFCLTQPTRISEETSLMACIQRHPPHHACGTHFHQNATNNHQNMACCCEHELFHLQKKKAYRLVPQPGCLNCIRKFDVTSWHKWEIVNIENGGRILVENPHMKKNQRHNT